MTALLLVVTIAYSALATAEKTVEKNTCTTTQSHNPLVASPRPDWVGFCNEFALRSALHQYRCTVSNDLACKAPSAVNLLLLGAKSSPVGIPNILDHLKGLEVDGIADEECFPFEKMFPPPTANEAGSFENVYGQAILKAFGDILTVEEKQTFMPKPCPDEADKSIEDLKEFASSVAVRARNKVYSYMQKKLDSSGCVRHKFPKVEPVTIIDETHAGQLSKLRDVLETGAPAVVPLFVKQPKGEEKSFHAVMISNYRQTCCQGVCVREYQIIDSLGYYWTEHQDGWVSEENLLESLPEKPEAITILVNPGKRLPTE